MGKVIPEPISVLDDNIETEPIIPAEYLIPVPSKPDEYLKAGKLCCDSLAKAPWQVRAIWIDEDQLLNNHFPREF